MVTLQAILAWLGGTLGHENLHHIFSNCELSLTEFLVFATFLTACLTILRLLINHDLHISAKPVRVAEPVRIVEPARVIKETYVVFIVDCPTAIRDILPSREVASPQDDV